MPIYQFHQSLNALGLLLLLFKFSCLQRDFPLLKQHLDVRPHVGLELLRASDDGDLGRGETVSLVIVFLFIHHLGIFIDENNFFGGDVVGLE